MVFGIGDTVYITGGMLNSIRTIGNQPGRVRIDEVSRVKNVSIKAFMGTWCGDSQDQTPVFYKILDETNFNYKQLQLVGVGHNKSTPDNAQEGYDIQRVPTFIFYKNSKEIGRFVEYPRETIEKDILKILSNQGYKHSYQE